MTNEQIELLYKQELEILEGWMRYRKGLVVRSQFISTSDDAAHIQLASNAIDASNQRLEKLEKQLRHEVQDALH